MQTLQSTHKNITKTFKTRPSKTLHAPSRAPPRARKKKAMSRPPRIIVVTYALQGHINPSLQFSKRLAAATGAHVTFVTTVAGHRRMSAAAAAAAAEGSSFPGGGRLIHAPFSDGYDDGVPADVDAGRYLSSFGSRGSQAISDLVSAAAADGRPYDGLVYTLLLPWAGRTADELRLPSFLLWIQPATVFDIYYYYFHGYEDALKAATTTAAGAKTTLPGLSLQLTSRDIPSFMDAANTYKSIIPLFEAQFEILDQRENPKVLVNTFDALEAEALEAIAGAGAAAATLVAVGPLIPSSFLGEDDPSDTSFGGDLFRRSDDDHIAEWLNSKPKNSVVYVSFGSISVLSGTQMEEIAKGLLDCGRPFLWVIRDINNNNAIIKQLSCDQEELEKLGLIVPWCGQLEVLSNAALGCFVTHCGWNSTLESLASGVPVVAAPQWSDQATNAKMVEDVWRVGVRARVGEGGVVESGELKRCLELVMEREELRENAQKWKGLAREAAKEGGSSDKNLKAFVAQVIGGEEARNGQKDFLSS